MPPPPLRFRLIAKPAHRIRRNYTKPSWSPFLLTRLDDTSPTTQTRPATAVFLLFAWEFLLCPQRPLIPQLEAPPPTASRSYNAHPSNAAVATATATNRGGSPSTAALPISVPTSAHHRSPSQPPSASLTSTTMTSIITSTSSSTIVTTSTPLTSAPGQLGHAPQMNSLPSQSPSQSSPRTPLCQNVRRRVPRPPPVDRPEPSTDPPVPFLPPELTQGQQLTRDQFIDLCDVYIQSKLRETDPTALPSPDDPVSVFYGVSPPPISVRGYLRRLVCFSESSPATFVIMLEFVRRAGDCESLLRLHNLNLHRLLITSLTVASKLVDDRCFSNAHYAQVGGVPSPDEMTTLELLLLRFLDYKLSVKENHLKDILDALLALQNNASCFLGLPVSMVTEEYDSGPAQS